MIPGVDDPATLEATACREALCLAEDLHIQNCVISSDSKQVISDINNGSSGRLGAIISEIRIKASIINCSFIFECRDVNTEAHSLAKFSLTLG